MGLYKQKLKAIEDLIKKGVAPQSETTRSFLLWFGAERRGYRVVNHIRSALKSHGLITVPDFEYAWIDESINFRKASELPLEGENEGFAIADPTYRIGRLDAANNVPTSVAPDSTLQQAVTIMLTNDFSQLPVTTGPRDVKGVISWKTIGSRLALKRPGQYARECMEPAQVVPIDHSLFEVIDIIAIHDYVLVQAVDKSISGIITASDFNVQFRTLSEPFLLVGEIENGVRRILHSKFTIKELESAKASGEDGRVIASPADLTFGEYIRLISPESKWKKLKVEIDRVEFLNKLNRVREIRNDVMHFDPEGLEPEDLNLLREFAQFLKRLREIGRAHV